MADPLQIEVAIRELCQLIDSSRRGLAARHLARSVVALVKDRSQLQAVMIAEALDQLQPKFPRQ